MANRVSKRNVLKALAGTNWGQQNETLLITYIESIRKIQRTQNEALMIITGSHKMSIIDHLHSETEMLQVEDHLNLLSAQYLV